MSGRFERSSSAGTITARPAQPAAPRRRTGRARLLGALGMLMLTGMLFWMLTDEEFRVVADSVTVAGVEYGDEQAVRDRLTGMARSPNVFRVRASELVGDLRGLPEVSSAVATVTLPANVSIEVREREPLFAWSDGAESWLVDDSGVLFARQETERADDPERADDLDLAGDVDLAGDGERDSPALGALPLVEDDRLVAEPLTVGSRLPQIDLTVMRQLLAVTPQLLGSESADLSLRIDQLDGYVLRSDLGWQAVFGHYSPTLQPADMVPRQVQCLAWLLRTREPKVERVRLSVLDDSCGTFTLHGRSG